MNDLLQKAVDAHGGIKRWNEVSTITVAASLTGAIWFVKSRGDYLKDVVVTVNTQREHMITDFPGQDKRFLFESGRLVMNRHRCPSHPVVHWSRVVSVAHPKPTPKYRSRSIHHDFPT